MDVDYRNSSDGIALQRRMSTQVGNRNFTRQIHDFTITITI